MLLGWAETKLWTLKYDSKSMQTSLTLRQRPPKLYKLLNFFISFVTAVKSRHVPTIRNLLFIRKKLRILKSITEIMKNFKSLYGFVGRCLNIWDVCMDFEPYFKVHNFVSVQPKSIMLGQMINFDMIFHVVVSVYRLVKIWNSPQFPVEFQNGLFNHSIIQLFNHSFTHSIIQSFNQSINHSIIQSFIHSFIHSIIQSLNHSINHSFIHSFNQSIIHSFIHSFNHSSIRLFIHSFIHSVSQSVNQPTNQLANQSSNQSISQSIKQTIN